MGFLDSMLEGAKNSLKWKVQSEATGGIEKGIERGIGAIAKRLKSKNKCPACKEPITEIDAKFCPHCRAKLILVCPNQDCKRESPLGIQFCPSCGTELSK